MADVALDRHLQSTATALKQMTLSEILDLTNATAAEISSIKSAMETLGGSSNNFVLPTVESAENFSVWLEVGE
mgnify:CR=1 FL=1